MSCNCRCTHGHSAKKEKKNSLPKDYWRIIVAGLLLFGGIAIQAMDIGFFQEEYIAFGWYLLAYLPVGLPVMKGAWESILQKDIFSEFTLMSIATLGAFYIGEYPEGVAVMFFYSLGEMLQGKAVNKARRNISALLDVRPEICAYLYADSHRTGSVDHTGSIHLFTDRHLICFYFQRLALQSIGLSGNLLSMRIGDQHSTGIFRGIGAASRLGLIAVLFPLAYSFIEPVPMVALFLRLLCNSFVSNSKADTPVLAPPIQIHVISNAKPSILFS